MFACCRIEEKVLIGQIVEKAVAYKDCLTKIVEFSLASLGNDPSLVFSKLSTALKVTCIKSGFQLLLFSIIVYFFVRFLCVMFFFNFF